MRTLSFAEAKPIIPETLGAGLAGRASRRTAMKAVLAALMATAAGAISAGARAQEKGRGPAKVTIDNFVFTPAALTVAAGTIVSWTNDDDIPHLVVDKEGRFRSEALDTGDSFSFTFAQPGSYEYFCGLHPHMVGSIIVVP